MKIELRTYLFSMLLLVAGMPAKADDVTKLHNDRALYSIPLN